MIAFAFAGLAGLICTFAEASSPESPPTPTATSQEQQEVRRNESPQTDPSNTPTGTVISTINQSTPQPTAQARETSCCENSKKSPLDYNALMVTIFTGVAAFVAGLQWRVMHRQIAYIRLDQRAWVAVTSITSNSPQIGQQFGAKIVVKNTGKTFARNLRVSCFSRLAPKEKTMNFSQIVEQEEALAKNRSVGVLAPDAVYGSGVSGEGTITQESFDRFRAGEILYIFGRVSYEDVFHRPHWTTYCSYITHGEPGSAVFEQYNDIDDDTPS